MAHHGERVSEILIADDDQAFVYLLRREFAKLSRRSKLHWAKDGAEALDFLYRRNAHANAPAPDLLLLDFNMPRMNGLETLTAIKSDPALSTLPVIALSTSAGPGVAHPILRAHANAFLPKPHDLDELTRLVSAIEVFWLEFAGSSSAYGRSLAQRDNGPAIAPHAAEVRSQAMLVVETKNDGSASRIMHSPASAGCQTQQRLTEDFAASVKELLALHEQQFQAILQDDTDCSRFDLLIHMANEKKQKAKYAYLRHVESHGCSNWNAVTNTSGT